jgi:glycosyltransferase 2 family protein
MSHYLGIPTRQSLPALLWLRLVDLHVVVGGALIVVALRNGPVALGLFLLWLGIPIAALAYSRTLLQIVSAHRERKAFRLLADALSAIPRSARALLENWLLTLANWALKLSVFAWIILQFTDTTYPSSLAGAIGGEISSILPIQGMAGFGTYEAGVIAGMRVFGDTVSEALTGAANLHLFILGVSMAAAVLSLLIPAPNRSHAPQEDARKVRNVANLEQDLQPRAAEPQARGKKRARLTGLESLTEIGWGGTSDEIPDRSKMRATDAP